ncbi:MAG: NAD(P)H-dependent oxidoreductase [Candidatus Omnitrophota bacterium]
MKKLLHLIATPRGDESRTLKVSASFLETFTIMHPEWVVDTLDLSSAELPALTVRRVDGKYLLLSGKELTGQYKTAWDQIVLHIERFLSADAYLVSTPMWNLSIPYYLKHYLDVVVQPKYLFQYTKTGVEGLVKGKKMAVIASRGGDYSAPPASTLDYQEPYLRAIFGFVGITDIQFVVAQPVDMGQQERVIGDARQRARELAERFQLEG